MIWTQVFDYCDKLALYILKHFIRNFDSRVRVMFPLTVHVPNVEMEYNA